MLCNLPKDVELPILIVHLYDCFPVMSRYLIQDHRFLDAFVVLLASLIVKARTLDDRIPGCQFIATVTAKENTYFERALERLGHGEGQLRAATIPNDSCTDSLINLMLNVAKSGSLGLVENMRFCRSITVVVYLNLTSGVFAFPPRLQMFTREILSVLVVCEWSYSSWGEIVAPITVRDDFVCYEWVDLHSGIIFRDFVDYLRRLLDCEGEILSEEQREKCKRRFLEAVCLEEEFFENAYANKE